MKKIISIFLAAVMIMSVFSILSLAGSRPANDPFLKNLYNAKNYIKQYVLTKEVYKSASGYQESTEYKYDSEGRLLSEDRGTDDMQYYSYDSNGNLESSTYYGSGSNDYYRHYTYDSKGNLTCFEHSSEDWGHYTYSYSYNSKGILTKIIDEDIDDYGYYDDEEGQENYPTIYYYKYNDDGLLSKIVAKKNGVVVGERTYKYDVEGLLLQMIYKRNDEVKEKNTYKYDIEGNLIKETLVDEDYTNEYTYKYNADDRLVKKTHKEDDYTITTSETTSFTYNDNGKLIKEVYKTSDNYSYSTAYSYNSKGQLAKEIQTFSDGDKQTVTYSYDSNGNNTKISGKTSDGKTFSTTYTYKKLAKPICLINGRIRVSHSEVTYNGQARKPKVSIDGMYRGADYNVSYENNVKPGKATIKITFTDPTIPPVSVVFLIRPAKVTGLKVTSKTKTSVSLSWSKVAKADKYVVYKFIDKSQKYVKVATVTSNKATIKKLLSKTVYKFCVKAVGGGVDSASYSAKVKVTTK